VAAVRSTVHVEERGVSALYPRLKWLRGDGTTENATDGPECVEESQVPRVRQRWLRLQKPEEDWASGW
jgi:hypothetical protein